MDETPIIYGLEEFHARTLTAQTAELEKINFLVGTQSLRNTNQVLLIEVDDDTGSVSKQGFNHPSGEIWGLSSAPKSSDLVATVYYNTEDYQTECGSSIFRLPLNKSSESVAGQNVELEKVCDLVDKEQFKNNCQIRSSIWSPEDDSKMVTLVNDSLLLLDVDTAGTTAQTVSEVSVEVKSTAHLGMARWGHHQQASQVSATFGSGIRTWDLRTMKPAWNIDTAHVPLVRSLDFNANRQYYVASCGDDCSVKVWDIRQPTAPLLTTHDHSHWVWSVRFNVSYDQLVVSCSSDQRVILSNLASVGSQPLTVFDEQHQHDPAQTKKLEDSILKTYENHEDSVYVVEWSAADSWTFASLSYDGRIVINKVPKSFKYKQFF